MQDGTGIHFVAASYTGPDSIPVFRQTANGRASATFTAPFLKPIEITIKSGAASTQVVVPVENVTCSLAATHMVRDIHQAETTPVTLSTNATDGAKVFWTVSNGASGKMQTFESLVANQTSEITVSSANAIVGDCIVTATVGAKNCWTKIRFKDSAPLSLEIQHPVLVGDQTGQVDANGNEINNTDTVHFLTTNGQAGPVTDDSTREVSIRHHAVTQVIIRGAANTTYKVQLQEAHNIDPANSATNYIQFPDLGSSNLGESGGYITTDATGKAVFRVHSRGNFSSAPTTSLADQKWFKHIVFDVTNATTADGAVVGASNIVAPQHRQGRITLVKKTVWEYTVDIAGSFTGFKDPNTASGMVSAMAGGVLVVGDIGSIIKNVWRMAGFSDTEPNITDLVLSSAGLLTEVVVGVGEAGDIPLSALNALVRKLGKTPFTEILVIIAKSPGRNLEDMQKFSRFLLKLITLEGFTNIANAAFHSRQAINAAQELGEFFADDFYKAIDDLAYQTVPRGVSPEAVRIAVEFIDSLDAEVKEIIKTAKYVSGAPATQLVLKNLVEIVEAGVDTVVLKQIFSTTSLFAPTMYKGVQMTYSQVNLIHDLSCVLNKIDTVDGVNHLLPKLLYGGNGPIGCRYELQVAAYLARDPNIANIKLPTEKFTNTAYGKTDFDVIADGVYYQVKVSREAFRARVILDLVTGKHRRATSDGALVEGWCKKVRSDAQKNRRSGKIVYVTPGGERGTGKFGPTKAAKAKINELKRKGYTISWLDVPLNPPLPP